MSLSCETIVNCDSQQVFIYFYFITTSSLDLFQGYCGLYRGIQGLPVARNGGTAARTGAYVSVPGLPMSCNGGMAACPGAYRTFLRLMTGVQGIWGVRQVCTGDSCGS